MHMYVFVCTYMYTNTCMTADAVVIQVLSFSWHPLCWGNTLQLFIFMCLIEELEVKPRWWTWGDSPIQLWQVLLVGGHSLVHI